MLFQKAPLIKFIQLLKWSCLGHNKMNQAKNPEYRTGRVDIAVEQCVGVVRPLIDYIGGTQSHVGSFLVGFGLDGTSTQKTEENISIPKSGSKRFGCLVLSLFCWIRHSLGFPLAWVSSPWVRISISIGIFTQTRCSAVQWREMWSHL